MNSPVDPSAETRAQPALAQTQKVNVVPASPQAQVEPASTFAPPPASLSADEKPLAARRWPWIVLGLFIMLLLGGLGTWLGYQAAIDLRIQKKEESRTQMAAQYFMAGLVAQENKQYEFARRNFEEVIKLDPNFPGAGDKLREVLTVMMIAQTPTPAPTDALPTLTPTQDMRPMEEIYNHAREQYANKDWDNLFITIDALRTADRTYRAIELDGMMYFALRFRGIDKILAKANLEGGLYDLALAEKYGPLDVDALGYRTWARIYLSGASFWDVDWLRVITAFEQVYPYFPNLRDGSGMTATERYRIAARNYADQLVQRGDSCAALEYYQKSLNVSGDDGLVATATAAHDLCYPPEPTATITPAVTPTVEVTQETPVPPTPETPTEEPPPGDSPPGDNPPTTP